MKRPSASNLVVASAVLLMGLGLVRRTSAQLQHPISCGNSALGCKDWHNVDDPSGGTDPNGDPSHKRCSLTAGNYKNYVARAWGCTAQNAIVNNSCDENQSEDDCCISSNSISCSTLTAVCPCPQE